MNFRRLTGNIVRSGKGLHSGRDFRLSVEPSETLSIEIEGTCLPLSKPALNGTGRGSDLIFPDGKRVRTCEHVFSALTGLGLWQVKLSVEGENPFEMPGLDGCSLDLAGEAAEKSVPSDGPKPMILTHPIQVGDDVRFVAAFPSASFRITYVIDYAAATIGTQIFNWDEDGDYLKEIAPARTFVMRADIEALRAAGLALGGSLDNAILVDEGGAETKGGLRFTNEFVRHKVLDLLGDLACLGRPLRAHVVAVRAGHVQHLQLVERLRAVWAGN